MKRRRRQQWAFGLGLVVVMAMVAMRKLRGRQDPAARSPESGASGEAFAPGVIDVTPGPDQVWTPQEPQAPVLTARLTGYYPVGPGATAAERRMEGGNHDRKGRPLYSLQQYLAGRAPYVSVAADTAAFPTYGEEIRILDLEKKYGRRILFRVVDTGGGFRGKGTSALDIRVDTKAQAEVVTGMAQYTRPEAGQRPRTEVA